VIIARQKNQIHQLSIRTAVSTVFDDINYKRTNYTERTVSNYSAFCREFFGHRNSRFGDYLFAACKREGKSYESVSAAGKIVYANLSDVIHDYVDKPIVSKSDYIGRNDELFALTNLLNYYKEPFNLVYKLF